MIFCINYVFEVKCFNVKEIVSCICIYVIKSSYIMIGVRLMNEFIFILLF